MGLSCQGLLRRLAYRLVVPAEDDCHGCGLSPLSRRRVGLNDHDVDLGLSGRWAPAGRRRHRCRGGR